MKKQIIISIALCAALQAAVPGAAAMAQGDYERAFSEGMKACSIDCDSTELNLLIANAANKIGNTNEALAAYDRVLIYDEDNIPAHFAMAEIYAKRGNSELLNAELEALRSNPNLSAQQRARLEQIQKSSAERAQDASSPLVVLLSAGFGYDSNPKHENNKSYKVFIDGEALDVKNDKSSGATSFNASIYAGYTLGLSDSLKLELNSSFFHKNYFKSRSQEYPDIDVLGLGLTPKISLGGQSEISLPIGYDFIILRGNGFLHSVHAGIDYNQYITAGTSINAGYSYARGIFEKSWDKDDNYNHHSAYAGFNANFDGQNAGFSVAYDIERANKSFSDTSDYNSISMSLYYYLPLSEQISINSGLGYTRTAYKKTNQIFLSKRRDCDYSAYTELAYNINAASSIAVGLTYGITDSNISANDSKNFGSSINYRYRF